MTNLFSRSVVSDSLRPHGLQHTRLPCPSPPPGVCSNSCSLTNRGVLINPAPVPRWAQTGKFSGRAWAEATWDSAPKTRNKLPSVASPGPNKNPSTALAASGFHLGTVLALTCKTARKTALSELGPNQSRFHLNYRWRQTSQLGLWALLSHQLI